MSAPCGRSIVIDFADSVLCTQPRQDVALTHSPYIYGVPSRTHPAKTQKDPTVQKKDRLIKKNQRGTPSSKTPHHPFIDTKEWSGTARVRGRVYTAVNKICIGIAKICKTKLHGGMERTFLRVCRIKKAMLTLETVMETVLAVENKLREETPSCWDHTMMLDHIRNKHDVRGFVHQLLRSFRHTHSGMSSTFDLNTLDNVRDLPPGLTKVTNAYMQHALHLKNTHGHTYNVDELKQVLKDTLVSECTTQNKNIKTADRIFLQELTKHDVLIEALHETLLGLKTDIMYLECCSEWLTRQRFFWYSKSPGFLLLFRTTDGRQPVYNGKVKLSNIISDNTARVFESVLTAQDCVDIIRHLWMHNDSIAALGRKQNIHWYDIQPAQLNYNSQLMKEKKTWLEMFAHMQDVWMKNHPGDTYRMGVQLGSQERMRYDTACLYGIRYDMPCFPIHLDIGTDDGYSSYDESEWSEYVSSDEEFSDSESNSGSDASDSDASDASYEHPMDANDEGNWHEKKGHNGGGGGQQKKTQQKKASQTNRRGQPKK